MIELKVKAVSPLMGTKFPLPAYATAGAAAMDLCACMEEPVTLAPGGRQGIPTGIAIALPGPEYVALVCSRSGMKEQLEKGDDRIEICELAGSSDYDLEDVMDTLYELAKEEKNPDDLEDRKLRAARVNKFLKDKNTNCIDGLMGLTELWLELGYTADSPHIIQGKDNSISPMEYYTDANYNYLYEKNKHWLKDEVYFLIHNEK